MKVRELNGMFDYEFSMRRVDAWFHGEVLDRVPVRFSRHNAQYDQAQPKYASRWPTLRDRWMDAEYQVDSFLRSLEGQEFKGESFPVYWPNLGPDLYAAFFGCELEFGEVTSWSQPIIEDLSDESSWRRPVFDPGNPYLQKLKTMTDLALEKCQGVALVGLTSWCPGIDCVAAWLGPENLCMNLMLEPERVKQLLEASMEPFPGVFGEFSGAIRGKGLPTVSWMGIPVDGVSHIAQADFSNMISPTQFKEFCLPYLREEIAGMDRVIFHMDGKGVANHLDYLLAEPGIQAIQWAQGVGDDAPILQWIPLIKRIQSAGKSVVVDLTPAELEPFMAQVRPEGIFLWIAAEENDQDAIVRRLLSWR
jgi:hypothetical protein